MVSNKKLANAVGGKSARACDGCIRKRARWYCAADDAFLCQSCDSSVHSANPLARRHERVRLKTQSLKTSDHDSPQLENFVPTWQRGLTKKVRTPRRHGKKYANATNHYQLPLVPEMMAEETNSFDENEEQLLYRVPIFDQLVAELRSSANSNEAAAVVEMSKAEFGGGGGIGGLQGFLRSEMDLAEFAADMECLLGKRIEEVSFDMEALGLLDCKQKDEKDSSMEGSLRCGRIVKVEDDNDVENREEGKANILYREQHLDTFELSFEYDEAPAIGEDERDKIGAKDAAVKEEGEEEGTRNKNKRMILLRLDYEAVLKEWADQRSPWTAGCRPELNGSDCWPVCMGSCGMAHHPYGDIGVMGGHGIAADGGREARVLRYREKRRTRLFSKKIRYEVRKLNAEKRPRMKGRFVKRVNFTAGGPVAFSTG